MITYIIQTDEACPHEQDRYTPTGGEYVHECKAPELEYEVVALDDGEYLECVGCCLREPAARKLALELAQ